MEIQDLLNAINNVYDVLLAECPDVSIKKQKQQVLRQVSNLYEKAQYNEIIIRNIEARIRGKRQCREIHHLLKKYSNFQFQTLKGWKKFAWKIMSKGYLMLLKTF